MKLNGTLSTSNIYQDEPVSDRAFREAVRFDRRTSGIVVTSTESERKEWLEEVKTLIDKIFPKTKGPREPIVKGGRRLAAPVQLFVSHEK